MPRIQFELPRIQFELPRIQFELFRIQFELPRIQFELPRIQFELSRMNVQKHMGLEGRRDKESALQSSQKKDDLRMTKVHLATNIILLRLLGINVPFIDAKKIDKRNILVLNIGNTYRENKFCLATSLLVANQAIVIKIHLNRFGFARLEPLTLTAIKILWK